MHFHTVLSPGPDDAANSSRWPTHEGENTIEKLLIYLFRFLD